MLWGDKQITALVDLELNRKNSELCFGNIDTLHCRVLRDLPLVQLTLPDENDFYFLAEVTPCPLAAWDWGPWLPCERTNVTASNSWGGRLYL